MAVTIHEIAKYAGVSIKTVSRVINNEPFVRDSTRTRVQKTMVEMGYSPNISAKRLASARSFVIGLLFGGAPGEYFYNIIKTSLKLSSEKGYACIVYAFDPFNPESRAEILHLVAQKSVDGLIFTPPCDNDQILLQNLEVNRVPLVRLTPSDHSLQLPCVSTDDWRGAYDMAEYLISLGHRRIGFVFGDPKHQASYDRFAGYQAALGAHEIPFDPNWVRQGYFQFDRGIEAGKELLQIHPKVTAIFASNDESASGVLFAAHEMGVKVPEELSVAGFDDFSISERTWPSLTTVHQPVDEIARQAITLLVGLMNNQSQEILQIKVPSTLVLRNSTSPCNQCE